MRTFRIAKKQAWFLALVSLCLLGSSAAGNEICVMTYNIYHGGQDTETVSGRADEWLDVIVSRNPDVLLVQEAKGWLAGEEGYLDHYVSLLNNAFPAEEPYVGYIAFANSRYHVACITRLPVTTFQFYNNIPVPSGSVRLAHVFGHLTLDAWGTTVHVLGVHFKAGAENREIRQEEAEALLAVLDTLPADEMVLIAGDFNSYSPIDAADGSETPPAYDQGAFPAEVVGWEPVGYLLDCGYIDAYRSVHMLDLGYTKETSGFLPGTSPINRVDFLLHNYLNQWQLDSVEVVDTDLGDIASDHYAVSARYVSPDYSSAGEITVAAWPLSVWPNPANLSSSIMYNLPYDNQVQVNVLNVEGRVVRQLVNSFQQSGRHEIRWDGRGTGNQMLPRGTYYLHLRSRGDERIISHIRY